jgi:NAD(P) transhydrogenase subunit alpha
MSLTIGILREPAFETRVSLLPEQIETLTKKNIKVLVESGAGEKAFADDQAYAVKYLPLPR